MKRYAIALLSAVAILMGLVAAPAGAIVGGVDAQVNPGVASLWTQAPLNRNRCSGQVLNDGTPADGSKWILTAGHCVWSLSNPQVQPATARTGTVSNAPGQPWTETVIADYYVHPQFDDQRWTKDAMMVELVNPVTGPSLKWNGLPSVAPDTIGTVQGYGWTCDGPFGEQCSTWRVGPLQRMAAKVLNDAECPHHMLDPQYKICFEEPSGAYVMACSGDSGAPFLTKDAAGDFWSRATIIGDADDQWTTSCHTAPDGSNGLGMATDTAAIWPWIGQVMAGQVPPTDTGPLWPAPSMAGRFVN